MSNEDIAQRLASIRHYFGKFTLVGAGVKAQGSVRDGFILSRSTDSDEEAVVTPEEPTGACCIGADCSIMTEADCVGAGGTYQGNDTVCDPNPCAVCPELTLVCDSISASKSKCGYTHSQLPDRYFLSISTSSDVDNPCPDITSPTHLIGTTTAPATGTISTDDCVEHNTNGNMHRTGPFSSDDVSFGIGGACSVGLFSETASGDIVTETYHSTSAACFGGGTQTVVCHNVKSYSDEYTTALLISNTEGAVASYSGAYDCEAEFESGQGCDCSAVRDLSTDEFSYSFQRFKPKFTFAAQSFAFTITYNEHFVPDVGSPTDTPRTISVGIGDTAAFGAEVIEPSSNGTITITDIACTIP